MSELAKDTMTGGLELIAFRIGEQEFCVDVMCVREIRGWTKTTPLPHSPDYVMGVINLRGAVLPVVDLSARLGLKPSEPSERHVTIVVQLCNALVGLLVDGVSDILTANENSIQPTPEVSSSFERSYARGILAIDKRMICLIDMSMLIESTESIAA